MAILLYHSYCSICRVMGCKIEQRGTQTQQTQNRQADSPSSSSSTNFLVTLGTTSPSWLYSSSDSSASLSTKSDMTAASHARLHRNCGKRRHPSHEPSERNASTSPYRVLKRRHLRQEGLKLSVEALNYPVFTLPGHRCHQRLGKRSQQPSAASSCQPVSQQARQDLSQQHLLHS